MAETRWQDLQDTLYPTRDILASVEPEMDYRQMSYDLLRQIYDGDPATGIQLGQGFARPIVLIISALEMGRLFTVRVRGRKDKKENPEITSFSNEWVRSQHLAFLNASLTKNKLGDSYIGFNVDRNLEVIDPGEAEPGFNLFDNKLNCLIRTVKKIVMDPKTAQKGEVVILSRYTTEEVEYKATVAKGSKINIKKIGKPTAKYPHTLLECPVVHIANNPSSDSVFGVSEFAPCVPFMNLWHKVLIKGYQSQQYHGQPITVINGIQTDMDTWLNKTFKISATSSEEDINIKMNDFFMKFKTMPLGDGADMHLVESANPLGSTAEILKIAFQTIVKICQIPEFMFGVAIESANASVREQFMALKLYIMMKRAQWEPHLVRLIKWALQYASILPTNLQTDQPLPEPEVKVLTPEQLDEFEIIIDWPTILNSDDSIKIEVLKMLSDKSAVSFKTLWENFSEFIFDSAKEEERLIEQNKNMDLQPVPTQIQSKQTDQQNLAKDRAGKDRGSGGNNSGKNAPRGAK